MTPQIDNSDALVINNTLMTSRTYKLSDTIISGFVDKKEAMKQAVYHILMTERYANLIYSPNYGIELKQYIGKGIDYLKMNITHTLIDALTYDRRITNVIVNSIELENTDAAIVKFTVYTIFGELEMGVEIGV